MNNAWYMVVCKIIIFYRDISKKNLTQEIACRSGLMEKISLASYFVSCVIISNYSVVARDTGKSFRLFSRCNQLHRHACTYVVMILIFFSFSVKSLCMYHFERACNSRISTQCSASATRVFASIHGATRGKARIIVFSIYLAHAASRAKKRRNK